MAHRAVWGAVVVLALLCGHASPEFSNTLELESVTTFYQCTDAFPEGFNDPFAVQACVAPDHALTAIRYLVQPGEDDTAGGVAMAFYTYPPPFAVQPINSDTNGAPPDNPCAFTDATTNCSAFLATGNSSGPITLSTRASHVAHKYYLKEILNGNRVPYTYTEHNLLVPRVDSEADTCWNQCDVEESHPSCDPTIENNRGYSFLAGCSTIDDYYSSECWGSEVTDKKDRWRPGSIFTSSQQYSQFMGGYCGPQDNYLLLKDDKAGTGTRDHPDAAAAAVSPPEECRACTAIYGKQTRGEAPQTNGNEANVQLGDCTLMYRYQDGDTSITPLLHPTLCPMGVGHYSNYPGTTSDLHTHAAGATDAYSLEPYYYWCQSQCVGDGSYTDKNVLKLQQDTTTACEIGSFDFGDEDGSLSEFITAGGEDQWNYVQYINAYLCSFDYDTCPEVNFAHSVDEYHLPCCNSTFIEPNSSSVGGFYASKCAPPQDSVLDDDIPSSPSCGGIAAEQVRDASAYLTAACDASDSGEAYCPGCASDYYIGHNRDGNVVYRGSDGQAPVQYTNGWQCPGWSYDHLRPGVSIEKQMILAKCSTECQTDEFVRWQIDHTDNQCTGNDKDNCYAYVEEVTSERAIVEMGYGGCRAYEVIPEPILDMAVEIILTAPDGTEYPAILSNTDEAASIKTVEVVIDSATNETVKFTHRLNQAFIRGGAGPNINGYILICNTDLGVLSPDDVCCKQENTQSPSCSSQGTYNPYNPADVNDEDSDIMVDDPRSDGFCTSGEHSGSIRGVFPYGYESDALSEGIMLPQMNPWQQLVRKMVQSRQQNANAGVHEISGEQPTNEMYACHVPSQRYLGVLNCGKPVYWFYVSEERKTSISTECGGVGIQNSYPFDDEGMRTMCLQGELSCTPGYGEPRFTNDGAPFYRTPCQELGDMVKTVMGVVDPETGQPTPCSANPKIPSALNMPGFEYLKDEDAQGSSTVVLIPNTWIHGDAGSIFLYQQVPTAQQQNVQMDVETYTDTYYGGNIQTYTDGILVPSASDNNTICFATANSQPGIFEVDVVNTNTIHGGQYLVSLSCTNTVNGQGLNGDPTPSPVFSPTDTGDILVDVGPGDSVPVSWEVTASGFVPNTTDTDDLASEGIGIPSCTATLYHGGGDFAKLYELKINCLAIAATLATPTRYTTLDETIQKFANCHYYQFFCWLSRQGPIEAGMVVVLALTLGVFGIILCYCQTRITLATADDYTAMKEMQKEIGGLEMAREKRQAALVRGKKADREKEAEQIARAVTAEEAKRMPAAAAQPHYQKNNWG